MKRHYTVPASVRTSRYPPELKHDRRQRRPALVLLATLGLLTGFLLYTLLWLGQPLRTRIAFADPDRWQTIDLDDIRLNDDLPDDAAWVTGVRTRVYVHPDFPILRVQQKDPLVENILVFGVDARSADDIRCRADSIIIVTVDRRNETIKLTSVMRDSQVEISGRSRPDRINAAYAYGGVGLLVNTLNSQLELDIQRFAMFDFYSAATLIDAAGGIEIDVQEAEIPYANSSISEQNRLLGGLNPSPLLEEAGPQQLNGHQAVAWARIRKLDSDARRTSRQRLLMSALIRQVASSRVTAVSLLTNGGLGAFETNMRPADLLRIGFNALPLSDSLMAYRVPEDGLYSINPNPWMLVADWPEQKQRLRRFIWDAGPTEDGSWPER